eukprot:NODE_2361_length_620_cov_27.588441_g2007_i0.p3 GENE.NODE_2361_length_620_cov_27.588441_g2007_i0~~NODE_2361_length_620_cov_27.588441_g2007_i0.p3  ORF type:complete len:133 (+),score=50.68 NODE_2361_length_620_cov_27.588441_g2007_i0:31-429(+)
MGANRRRQLEDIRRQEAELDARLQPGAPGGGVGTLLEELDDLRTKAKDTAKKIADREAVIENTHKALRDLAAEAKAMDPFYVRLRMNPPPTEMPTPETLATIRLQHEALRSQLPSEDFLRPAPPGAPRAPPA